MQPRDAGPVIAEFDFIEPVKESEPHTTLAKGQVHRREDYVTHSSFQPPEQRALVHEEEVTSGVDRLPCRDLRFSRISLCVRKSEVVSATDDWISQRSLRNPVQ